MDNLNFNDLEFNLYEILNLPYNCTTNDIKYKFKKLVKKFHPDKITELEEKIYYYITLAHHILTNIKSRAYYDSWLLQTNNQKLEVDTVDTINTVDTNHNNFNKEESINNYFPKTYLEASKSFTESEKEFKKKFNLYDEDTRKFSERYIEKVDQLNNIDNIKKENFKNMKEFNQNFSNKMKKGGEYYGQLLVYDKNNKIINHKEMNNSKLKYKNINDIDKIFFDDTVIGTYYTSIDIAHKLQSNNEIQKNGSFDNAINNYHNQTNSINKNNNNNFNNFNI